MLRYYITDRRGLGGADALLRNIERLGAAIDFLQIREKDLPARDLAKLVRQVIGIVDPRIRVLVNSRADIALACGAHGVHLPANSIHPGAIRGIAPRSFLVSVACHNLSDLKTAESEGADYALLSPIYAAPGKGPALGIDFLLEATRQSSIPILALGGVSRDRIAGCARAGAAGFAAIRLFQEIDAWPPL